MKSQVQTIIECLDVEEWRHSQGRFATYGTFVGRNSSVFSKVDNNQGLGGIQVFGAIAEVIFTAKEDAADVLTPFAAIFLPT